MEIPSPREIITRAVVVILGIVAVLYGTSFYKKYQRKAAIVSELKSICSDSSFFHQFYEEDARKSLLRAVALIAEAKQLGMPPDKAIDAGLGIEDKFFATDADREEPPVGHEIVRTSLNGNYQNFIKLGYQPDFGTLEALKGGSIPAITGGPESGRKPVVVPLIPMKLSPGIEKVIANLEIRPPGSEERALTDIEVASAKKLARDLCDAHVIEDKVRDHILQGLTAPTTKAAGEVPQGTVNP